MLRPRWEKALLRRPEHAGHVSMHMDVACAGGAGGSCTCGKLTAPTVVPTSEYSTSFLRNLGADALLRLFGRSADVRCQNHVVESPAAE